MCRPVANQTRCAQTVVCNSIDRANDFLNAGFIRPFGAICTVRIAYCFHHSDSHFGVELRSLSTESINR
jgi:hypothetical protein